MKAASPPPPAPADGPAARGFATLFGALLGLSLLKFGNPVVLAQLVEWPKDRYEWIFMAWPNAVALPLLLGVAVLGLLALRWRELTWRWELALPLGWLGWEALAAGQSAEPASSWPVVLHFGTCVLCYLLGTFSLTRRRDLGGFWLGLLAGFAIILTVGLEQHFGGLAETRRQFHLYIEPTLKVVPPDLLKRISSDRIFSTLFYPNALAGVLLLLLPALLAFLWECDRWLTRGARLFLIAAVGGGALGCLFWSGSKGGWLLMLLLGLVTLLRLPMAAWWKWVVMATVLLAGLTGFGLRYAGFFERGATSVSARFDYWRAAAQTAAEHPVWGTGPGTFARAYARIKRPESEMSRLVHNDYLQQASDSGVPGLLAYAAFVVWGLVRGFPRGPLAGNWLRFGVWLGLLGWALQSLFEFGLYIPALAWPAFTFLGWISLAAPANRGPQSPPSPAAAAR